MSKYVLPTAILLSFLIHVDLLPMNARYQADQLFHNKRKSSKEALLGCIKTAQHKFGLREVGDKDLKKMKIEYRGGKKGPKISTFYFGNTDDEGIQIIKYHSLYILNLNLGEFNKKKPKECKKRFRTLNKVLSCIKIFNLTHKRQLLYSEADWRETYKGLCKWHRNNNRKEEKSDDFLNFVRECEEQSENCDEYMRDLYAQRIDNIRSQEHAFNSDCAFVKSSKKKGYDQLGGVDITDQEIYDYWEEKSSPKKVGMCACCTSRINQLFNNRVHFCAQITLAKRRNEKLKRRIDKEQDRLSQLICED